MDIDEKVEAILEFWFGLLPSEKDYPEEQAKKWFAKDDAFDRQIKDLFSEDVLAAARGEYDIWTRDPRACLALILLLDQFPRNLYRGKPEAFAQDEKALKIALKALEKGHHLKLFPVEQIFFYLPLEHSEDLAIQEKSVLLFQELVHCAPEEIEAPLSDSLDYAVSHYEIVKRFGRFPHRNSILGRESSDEEESFLKEWDSAF